MNFNKDDFEFFSKLMSGFKKTQPRKKRQNIDRAFRKVKNIEPLNRLEREAHSEFIDFMMNYDFDLYKIGEINFC